MDEIVINSKNNLRLCFHNNYFTIKNDKYKFIIQYDSDNNSYNIKLYYNLSFYESIFSYNNNKYITQDRKNGTVYTCNELIYFKTMYYPINLIINTNDHTITFLSWKINILNNGNIEYYTNSFDSQIEISYKFNNKYQYIEHNENNEMLMHVDIAKNCKEITHNDFKNNKTYAVIINNENIIFHNILSNNMLDNQILVYDSTNGKCLFNNFLHNKIQNNKIDNDKMSNYLNINNVKLLFEKN